MTWEWLYYSSDHRREQEAGDPIGGTKLLIVVSIVCNQLIKLLENKGLLSLINFIAHIWEDSMSAVCINGNPTAPVVHVLWLKTWQLSLRYGKYSHINRHRARQYFYTIKVWAKVCYMKNYNSSAKTLQILFDILQ